MYYHYSVQLAVLSLQSKMEMLCLALTSQSSLRYPKQGGLLLSRTWMGRREMAQMGG